MAVRLPIEAVRRGLKDLLWQAQTLARVPFRVGMHEDVRIGVAAMLLAELSKGRSAPSLLFRFLARNSPHKIGIIAPAVTGGQPHRLDDPARDRLLSFFEIDAHLDRIAAGLAARGIGKGSATLVALKNRPEHLLVPAAVGRLGAAAVTVSWRSTVPELEYVARHSGAKAFLFDAEIAPNARELIQRLGMPHDSAISVGGKVEGFPSIDEIVASHDGTIADAGDEAAVVMYTSGTTGKPKGAVRTFPKSALIGTLGFVGQTPMRVGEVHLAVCPLYHATAFGFASISYLLRSTVVVLPDFRPETFLEAIERYRVTTTAVVPTMLHRLLEIEPRAIRAYDTSSLKAIFCGGAQLSGPLAARVMDALGDKLYNFYGATETGIVTMAGPTDLRASPGTIGVPVPGIELRLIDADGRPAERGEVGELYVRSPLVVEGYHADATATNDAMRDGFFSVGDLARYDARGCLHIEGRMRDMIISGGVNVYPAEVEAAIESHAGVAEVAVIGVADPEWGERVRAFVVAERGAACTEAELRAYCRERLAGPKVPREFVFLDALPRNPTGKVLKRELRDLR